MRNKSFSGGWVYSTDAGRMCPACRQAQGQCVCKPALRVAGDGVLRVSRQTQGRAGKSVTLVKGLAVDAATLAVLCKQLKTACGSGGTVKDGVIEIQGDQVGRVLADLLAQGHQAKQAGA